MSHKLILASSSPRRKKLLEDAGFTFTVMAADIEELMPEIAAPRETAIANALAKARHVAEQNDSEIVIGASGAATLNGRV